MKRYFKSRVLVFVVLASLMMATVNCGYIMYPERKGQASGKIDPEVLILDCLWFLGGIVPGVIALIVDFSSGCIYEPGTSMNTTPGAKFAFRLNDPAPISARLSITLKAKNESQTLWKKDFVQGEKLEHDVMFALPEDLASGDYQVSININDRPSVAWNLKVVR